MYWLQSRLKDLGFYKGTVTGQYRDGTKAAVREYQKAHGLGSNGVATLKVLEHLRQLTLDEAITPPPAETAAPAFVVDAP